MKWSIEVPIKYLDFKSWVNHVFDHEVVEPSWYFDYDAPKWDGPAGLTVDYVTRLFENPTPVLASFTDAQLDQGFYYLVGESGSNHICALAKRSVPLQKRVRCLNSIVNLFRELFASHCSPHLSDLDEPGVGALNRACYMWWDILAFPHFRETNRARSMEQAALKVMSEILTLDSIPCQESAIHGLGHWQQHYPKEVGKIIDQFLRANSTARPELLEYAQFARLGNVL